jgi:multiple sugar transport system substrate-binding protein
MQNNNTIKIAVRQFGPFETALQKLWANYCAQSGCTLQTEMVPMDLEVLHKTILDDDGLKNGDWDIAHVVTDWLYEAWRSGALANLKPYIKQNPPDDYPHGWSNSLLEMQQFDNGIAGLPFHDGPECFIYRKDLFENETEQKNYLKQYGKPLTVPKTWDDFKTIARFFNRPEENLYGSVFAGYPDGHNTVFDFVLQLWTRGGKLTDINEDIIINSPEALNGLEFYRDMLRDKSAVHPHSMGYESVQMGMAFARGEAAMMVNWFGFASMCEVLPESKVKGKVDIAPLPSAGGETPASLNVYWLYTIGSGSRHKDVAYDFIRFAINQHSDKLLTLEGGIGCRKSTWNDGGINYIVPYYHKLEQMHGMAQTLPRKSNWAQIAKVIDEVVLAAINTDEPVGQLLAQGQQKINQLNLSGAEHEYSI